VYELFHFWLDCMFWNACHCHHRQRHAIHFINMDCACRLMKIKHIFTTAYSYHPKSNGMVERVHRQGRPMYACC